ncbi:unnamed protein product [Vitrella brassicaformis CCMP3155]|uniref:Hemimethylated DNA-binding domain-containing protein n=3 Tax=Vitrella brassicaformis TaxID=1169539 RepID=A0A0G4G408_VITBC|nr:unnamed protein product [Vitrella brassicaformis CCMP3155]|eukprot:CEM23168.1 unnamed protein product [Vitrella brassicaformis CCMP3155]
MSCSLSSYLSQLPDSDFTPPPGYNPLSPHPHRETPPNAIDLPTDIWLRVGECVDGSGLMKLKCVNPSIRHAIRLCDDLWRRCGAREFPRNWVDGQASGSGSHAPPHQLPHAPPSMLPVEAVGCAESYRELWKSKCKKRRRMKRLVQVLNEKPSWYRCLVHLLLERDMFGVDCVEHLLPMMRDQNRLDLAYVARKFGWFLLRCKCGYLIDKAKDLVEGALILSKLHDPASEPSIVFDGELTSFLQKHSLHNLQAKGREYQLPVDKDLNIITDKVSDAMLRTKARHDRRCLEMLSKAWRDEAFQGNTDSYYVPDNSFVHRVAQTKRGIPISLSIVYLAMARRVGVDLIPMNYPGHFMLLCRPFGGPSRFKTRDEYLRLVGRCDAMNLNLVIDPFNGAAVHPLNEASRALEGVLLTHSFRTVIHRTCLNLLHIYRQGQFCNVKRLLGVVEVITCNRDAHLRELGLTIPNGGSVVTYDLPTTADPDSAPTPNNGGGSVNGNGMPLALSPTVTSHHSHSHPPAGLPQFSLPPSMASFTSHTSAVSSASDGSGTSMTTHSMATTTTRSRRGGMTRTNGSESAASLSGNSTGSSGGSSEDGEEGATQREPRGEAVRAMVADRNHLLCMKAQVLHMAGFSCEANELVKTLPDSPNMPLGSLRQRAARECERINARRQAIESDVRRILTLPPTEGERLFLSELAWLTKHRPLDQEGPQADHHQHHHAGPPTHNSHDTPHTDDSGSNRAPTPAPSHTPGQPPSGPSGSAPSAKREGCVACRDCAGRRRHQRHATAGAAVAADGGVGGVRAEGSTVQLNSKAGWSRQCVKGDHPCTSPACPCRTVGAEVGILFVSNSTRDRDRDRDRDRERERDDLTHTTHTQTHAPDAVAAADKDAKRQTDDRRDEGEGEASGGALGGVSAPLSPPPQNVRCYSIEWTSHRQTLTVGCGDDHRADEKQDSGYSAGPRRCVSMRPDDDGDGGEELLLFTGGAPSPLPLLALSPSGSQHDPNLPDCSCGDCPVGTHAEIEKNHKLFFPKPKTPPSSPRQPAPAPADAPTPPATATATATATAAAPSARQHKARLNLEIDSDLDDEEDDDSADGKSKSKSRDKGGRGKERERERGDRVLGSPMPFADLFGGDTRPPHEREICKADRQLTKRSNKRLVKTRANPFGVPAEQFLREREAAMQQGAGGAAGAGGGGGVVSDGAGSGLRLQYSIGQVFRHRKYRYRGVIFGWDARCQATEQWKTRMGIRKLPRGEDQPYYHALVHPEDRPDMPQFYVAEVNVELVPADELASDFDFPHEDAGKYFSAFDKDTLRFVPKPALSNRYPDG